MAKGFLIVVSVIFILIGISIVLENLPSASGYSSPKTGHDAPQEFDDFEATLRNNKTQTEVKKTNSTEKVSSICTSSIEASNFCSRMQGMNQIAESNRKLEELSELMKRRNGGNTLTNTNPNSYLMGTRNGYSNYSNSQPLFNSAINDMIIRHRMFTP